MLLNKKDHGCQQKCISFRHLYLVVESPTQFIQVVFSLPCTVYWPLERLSLYNNGWQISLKSSTLLNPIVGTGISWPWWTCCLSTPVWNLSSLRQAKTWRRRLRTFLNEVEVENHRSTDGWWQRIPQQDSPRFDETWKHSPFFHQWRYQSQCDQPIQWYLQRKNYRYFTVKNTLTSLPVLQHLVFGV